MDITQLIELDQLARQQAGQYSRKRLLYDTLHNASGRHFIGIVGPRGRARPSS